MSKRFRCGRLILKADGKIKKIGLEDGGGSRFCDWYKNDMTFDDIHYCLNNIFNLSDTDHETTLYDFQLCPLNINQYETFSEYLYNNGLSLSGTVIYLCTKEADDNSQSKKKMLKTSSSSASTDYKQVIKQESLSNQQQLLPHLHGDQLTSTDFDTSVSCLDYSFKKSSYDLMADIRHLFIENGFDEILAQLFKYICIIHGYVCSIIDPLNEQMQYLQALNPSEIKLYSNGLNDVDNICQSTSTLMKTNEEKFNQIHKLSVIANSFVEFYGKLKILHNQWLKRVENNLSITSPHEHPEVNKNTPKKQYLLLFQDVMTCLNNLKAVMTDPTLSSFHTMIKSIIVDIRRIGLNINLYDHQSICNVKQIVTSLRARFTKIFNRDVLTSPQYEITQSVEQAHHKTLKALCDLVISLSDYQFQAENNLSNNSNRSSMIRTEQLKNTSENLHAGNNTRTEMVTYSSRKYKKFSNTRRRPRRQR